MLSYRLSLGFCVMFFFMLKSVNTMGIYIQPPPEESLNTTSASDTTVKESENRTNKPSATTKKSEQGTTEEEIPLWQRVLAFAKDIVEEKHKKNKTIQETKTKARISTTERTITPRTEPSISENPPTETLNNQGRLETVQNIGPHFTEKPYIKTQNEEVEDLQRDEPFLSLAPSGGMSKNEDQIVQSVEHLSIQKPSTTSIANENIGKTVQLVESLSTKEFSTKTAETEAANRNSVQVHDDDIDAGKTSDLAVSKVNCESSECNKAHECEHGTVCTYVLIFSSSIYFYHTIGAF